MPLRTSIDLPTRPRLACLVDPGNSVSGGKLLNVTPSVLFTLESEQEFRKPDPAGVISLKICGTFTRELAVTFQEKAFFP
jgi:hypothetical protein